MYEVESFISNDVTLIGLIVGFIVIGIFFAVWDFIMNNIFTHQIFENNLFIRGGLFFAYAYGFFVLLIEIGYFSSEFRSWL